MKKDRGKSSTVNVQRSLRSAQNQTDIVTKHTLSVVFSGNSMMKRLWALE